MIHHLFNPRLYNELGALVARVHGYVERPTRDGCRILIHDCVHLRVTHVRVLGLQRVIIDGLFTPRKRVIGAPAREPVVPDAQDEFILAHDARAHLFIRILASLRREKRHRHEIIVPRQIPRPFRRVQRVWFRRLRRRFAARFATLSAIRRRSAKRLATQRENHRRWLVRRTRRRRHRSPPIRCVVRIILSPRDVVVSQSRVFWISFSKSLTCRRCFCFRRFCRFCRRRRIRNVSHATAVTTHEVTAAIRAADVDAMRNIRV